MARVVPVRRDSTSNSGKPGHDRKIIDGCGLDGTNVESANTLKGFFGWSQSLKRRYRGTLSTGVGLPTKGPGLSKTRGLLRAPPVEPHDLPAEFIIEAGAFGRLEHFQEKHALAKARVESGFPCENAMQKCSSGFFLRSV
jgi:hypothetical protein